MSIALELAKNGYGKTNPNPLVGAVIVKDGNIISKGYHHAIGSPHAEIEALNNAQCTVRGATMYVNLEPCSHYGRTPPCTKAIIEAGINEVVIATEDPNPMVCGKGIKLLKDAGISVVLGVLEQPAKRLNEIFIKYITKKRPFVIMKSAMTLDGKIATCVGNSKWITCEDARRHVHIIRNRVSAIMVGINTILYDNPSLTTRLNSTSSKNAIPIIVDSKGAIPLHCKVMNADISPILATTSIIDRKKEAVLVNKGVKIIKCDQADGRVDLNILMDELYKLEVDSVLLEGGGTLNWSAIESAIVDKVMCYIAPKLIGGTAAKTPIEGTGIPIMHNALSLNNVLIQSLGHDFLIEGYI